MILYVIIAIAAWYVLFRDLLLHMLILYQVLSTTWNGHNGSSQSRCISRTPSLVTVARPAGREIENDETLF